MAVRNNKYYESAIELIKSSNTIAIISHMNPDGDTLGASLALRRMLKMYGKKPYIFCADLPSLKLRFIPETELYNADSLDSYDLAISVDTADYNNMGQVACEFEKAKSKLVIDHHVSNKRFGDVNLVETASATCELMYDLLCEFGEIDDIIAKQLYCGLVTDSGNFAFSSVTSTTLCVASELIKYDIKAYEISETLMRKKTVEKFNLMNRVLVKTRFFDNNYIGIVTITPDDFVASGSDRSHTDGIVNCVRDVEGVEIAIALTEVDNAKYKISIRTGESINSNSVAQRFGGGGHKNAAGCMLCGYYEDVVDKLLKACRDEYPY